VSDEFAVQMSLPLDGDGFLRRECPTCEREFKWLPSDESEVTPEDAGYYCPYCGVQADTGEWWTQAQLEHRNALLMKEVVVPEVQKGLADVARQSRGFLVFKPGKDNVEEPPVLVEPDDMCRVDFACHPTEPVKILEDWTKPVHCLVCGELKD
jgi:hypothetical protein